MWVMMNGVRQLGSNGPGPDAERAARQIELPLKVPVCAWCQPHELGEGLGAISHGICPRHFRQLLQETCEAYSSATVSAAA